MGLVYNDKKAGSPAVAGEWSVAELTASTGIAATAATANALYNGGAFTAPAPGTAVASTAAQIAGLQTTRAEIVRLQAALAATQGAATATIATGVGAGTRTAAQLAEDLAAIDAAILAASGTAAVAAVDSIIRLEKQMTVTMAGSVETTSGLTFGAALNLRSNEATGTVAAGARVHMASNGFEVAVGNIYGAIDSMPNLWNGIGLTGLGHGFVVANTDLKGAYKWDAYSSSGNGAEGIEVIYSAGGFTGHLSYSDKELSSGASAVRTVAAMGAYTMGDWTVAIAMQDSDTDANDKTIVTVGGKVGDFGLKLAAADNDGVSKISLAGSATMGATTVTGYVADDESGANTGYGLGLSHDLGGAALKAGLVRSTAGRTSADMGVSFSF